MQGCTEGVEMDAWLGVLYVRCDAVWGGVVWCRGAG